MVAYSAALRIGQIAIDLCLLISVNNAMNRCSGFLGRLVAVKWVLEQMLSPLFVFM